MKILLIVVIALVVLTGAYVRLAPSIPGQWHRDPLEAPLPGRKGVLMRPGFQPAPVFDLEAAELLARMQSIALATDRTRILAGDVENGMITFVTRSRLWGFPDYTTVKSLVLTDGQSTLAIHGRARFGQSDLGVNRARVGQWLQLLQALDQP